MKHLLFWALTTLCAVSSAFGQTNPLAEARRFVRGDGTDPSYQSFVIPLDFEKGVPLDAIGDSTAKFNNQVLWFARILKGTAYHVSINNGTASYPDTLKFENPIAAFGGQGGGTPLRVNQVYRFGFNAGGQVASTAIGDLKISVYQKSAVSGPLTNVPPYATLSVNLPRKNTAAWDAFAANGYTQQVDLVLSGQTTPILKTSVQYVEGASLTDQWGSTVQAPLLLSHTATTDQYYYKIEYAGVIQKQNGSNPNIWMAVTDSQNPLATPAYSIGYTLDFEQLPAWTSTFIPSPHFEGEPAPPAYAGKSVAELLNVSAPFSGSPTLAPAACLALNQSPELRTHPILDRLVSDLKSDPIALANYVFNEIELTDALSYNENGNVSEKSLNQGGVNRSALATLQEGQGSPWEQCALLVYLLRKSSIPAVYMEPEHNKLQMFDARMSTLLKMQIKGALDYKGSPYGAADPSQPTLIPVNYPWVAAYVPDSANPGQSKWVHLYPWLKDTEIIEGQNLYDYLPAGYNSGLLWAEQYLNRDAQIFPSDVDAFKQGSDSSGFVAIEAEHYANKVDQGGNSWVLTSPAGSSGGQAMSADPNIGRSVDTGYSSGSPRLDYKVNFTKTGTHYVWLRASGTGTGDRTAHVGLDGAAVSTADRISGFTASLGWSRSTSDGPVATISVAAVGVHTINVWMREDGFVLDKLLLTTDSAYSPTSNGPTESVQASLLDDTPSVLFPKFVAQSLLTSAPGISIDDIGTKVRNRRNYRLRWEDFPAPFKVEGNPTTTESLKNKTNIFDTVNIQVFSNANPTKQVMTGDLRMLDLHNRKLLVRYDNTAATLNLFLAPYYSDVSGQGTFAVGANPDPDLLKKQVAVQALDASDDALTVRVIHKRNRRLPTNFALPEHWASFLGVTAALQFSNDRPLRKGDLAAICLNVGRVTPKMLRPHAEEYWQMERTLAANPAATIDTEISQGTSAYLMGMAYYQRVNRFKEQCERLHKTSLVSFYAVGLSKLSPKRVNGALAAGILEMTQPSVDMFFYKAAHASNGTLHGDSGNLFTPGTKDFWPIFITNVSAQEHQIINGYYKDAAAISTVRLLSRAKDTASAGILNLTKANYAAQGNTVYAGTPVNITWTNLVGTTATYPGAGSQLQKTAAGDAWNSADAIGANVLTGDGYVQFRFGQTNKHVMAALSSPSNPDRSYTSLSYAIYGAANGTIQIYESGVLRGTFPAYTTADVFKIERTGTTVRYFKNDAVFYPSTVASSGALIVDTSFFTSGASLTSCQYGESKKLQDWDANMWSGAAGGPSVAGAFAGVDADYIQVFMTPGPMSSTTGAYRGMGAMIYGRDQLSALISANLAPTNGGFGNYLPFSYTTNLPSLSLGLDAFNNYSLSYFAPTVSAPILAPSLFSPASTSNLLTFATSNSLTYSSSQVQWTSKVSEALGTANNFATSLTTSQNNGFFGTLSTFVNNTMEFVADPVNVVTGEFYTDTTDLRLNGPMPLEIRRNYSSQNVGDNEFGYGWKMNYTPFLVLNSDASLIYAAEPEGSVIAYRRQANPNQWLPTAADNLRYSNVNHGTAGGTSNLLNAQLVKSTAGADTFYTLTGPDGSIRTFKVQNFPIGGLTRSRPYLTKWQDHAGNFYVFTYGTDSAQTDYGELRRIDATNGNFIGFQYDTFGHIVEAYTGDGRRLTYEYDSFGDLIKVTLPDASEWSYEYEKETTVVNGKNTVSSKHLLIREIKPGGRILENTYDSSRRVTLQKATAGQDMVPVVNATFDYSVANKTKLFDAYNRETDYEYNASKLVTKVTDPVGFTTTDWYDVTDVPTGAYNRAIKKETDKRGFITEYKYDGSGNLIESKTTGDVTGDGVSETFTTASAAYNARNLPTVIKDAANNSTAYFYDNATDLYLPTRMQKLNGGTLAGGILTGATLIREDRLDFYGVPATPVANVTSATGFDAFSKGLLQRKTVAFGPGAAIVEWSHNATGFAVNRTAYTGTGDPNVVTGFVPNLRGEVVEQSDALGRKAEYFYDAMGRRTGVEYREEGVLAGWNYDYYNGNGEVEWSDGPRYDPEDYTWRKYDGAGRRSEEIRWRSQAKADGSGVEAPVGDALTGTSFFKYDLFNNLVETRDARGNSVAMGYDGIGRLLQRDYYEGYVGAGGTLKAGESFQYEPGGEVSQHTGVLGGVTYLYYAANGRMKKRVNADGSAEEWRYSNDGRIVREILRNGSYWETTYDDVGLTVTRRLKTAGGAVLKTQVKSCDRRGNCISETVDGFTFTKTYDGLDRPKTVTGPVATATSAQQATTYTYDASGKVLTVTNAAGESTVTTSDVLGRPVLVQVKNAGGTVVRQTGYAYSPDHHKVTVTEGTGAGAIVTQSWTDTFGSPILNKKADGTNEYFFYDNGGLLTDYFDRALRDAFYVRNWRGDVTQEVRDILQTNTGVSVGPVINYVRDVAGNILQRNMPGGLSEQALFDNAGRMTLSKLMQGGSTTRLVNYAYYPAGNAWAGLLNTAGDARGILATYSYDAALRVAGVAETGTDAVSRTLGYNERDMATSVAETSSNGTTQVTRTFDGYGGLGTESVSVGGTVQSSLTQYFDAAGRRWKVSGAGADRTFGYRADGLMTGVGMNGNTYSVSYADNGLLTGRSNPFRSVTVQSRDSLGRMTDLRTSVGGVLALKETVPQWWAADKVFGVYSTRAGTGAWNESRDYRYDSSGRLVREDFNPIPGYAEDGNKYYYDGSSTYGATGGVGVRTKTYRESDLMAVHEVPGVATYARVLSENVGGSQPRSVPLAGAALGAASVKLTLDGRDVSPVAFPGWQDAQGQWSASANLAPGNHSLTATATHPSGWVAPAANSFFQMQARAETVTDGYDGMGNVSSRVWSLGKAQALTWDGNGRLIKVVQTGVTPFVWTAIYDGLNRRVKTTYTPSGGATVTTNSVFDPQVEFLELGLAINGAWNWKVYGPDLSGSYGGLQGLGGLESVVGSDGITRGIVNDWFGNAAGYVAAPNAAMTWSSAQFLAWGPAPGWGTAPLDGTKPLHQLLGYRGLTLDPPGYVHMGLRDYAPEAGRWLSPDSMGHGASMSLYDYCGNDPLNVFDMDGRFGKAVDIYNRSYGMTSAARAGTSLGPTPGDVYSSMGDFYKLNQGVLGNRNNYTENQFQMALGMVQGNAKANWEAIRPQVEQEAQAYGAFNSNPLNAVRIAGAELGTGAVNGMLNVLGGDVSWGIGFNPQSSKVEFSADIHQATPGQQALGAAFLLLPGLIEARGGIQYGALDSLGRPTGVTATITRDMILTGTPPSQYIVPPGFKGGAANQGRGHLLGAQLGGSGTEVRNLVTLTQNPTNSPIMRGFEQQIRKAVEGGQVFQGGFTPIYIGNNLVPRGITIMGQGTGGFNIGVSILNPAGL